MFSTLADDCVTLHYQPLADCSGKVVGLEALMRWHHQQRGSISPEAFIPIFEQSGLILPLSRWALTQACLDAASWSRPLFVSVNLSPIQFEEEDVPALIRSVLAETSLAPGRLELEMTEAALLADSGHALDALKRLRSIGVDLALDDFGIGQSSSAFLENYPFTKVKIDRNVIAHIEASSSAKSIVHMIIELAHALNLRVAAEGVETQAQLDYLAGQGCDLIQGFLIGRPEPIAAFNALTGAPAQCAARPKNAAMPSSYFADVLGTPATAQLFADGLGISGTER